MCKRASGTQLIILSLVQKQERDGTRERNQRQTTVGKKSVTVEKKREKKTDSKFKSQISIDLTSSPDDQEMYRVEKDMKEKKVLRPTGIHIYRAFYFARIGEGDTATKRYTHIYICIYILYIRALRGNYVASTTRDTSPMTYSFEKD